MKYNITKYTRTAGACTVALASSLLWSCADEPSPQDLLEEEEFEEQELFVDQDTRLWPNGKVPVCWSIDPNVTGKFPLMQHTDEERAAFRATVREAVDNSWARVAKIDFTGWKDCPSNNPKGQVELITEDSAGGLATRGYNGKNATPIFYIPARRANLVGLVLHEFGHVLGFSHEMDRTDFPNIGPGCTTGVRPGNRLDTPPDPTSILAGTGYCNDNSALSHWDIVGAQKAYGPRGQSAYLSFRSHTATALHETGASFEFAIADNDDVFAISKSGTGTGTTELHVLSAAGGYQSFALHTGTIFGEAVDNVTFLLGPNRDLYAIAKYGTGSHTTEVHVISAASGYSQYSLQTGTALHETDGAWEFELANNGDLFAIKKSGGGSGATEVHVLSAASGYQEFALHAATAFGPTDANFDFLVAPNRDLYAVIKARTGTTSTELHVLSADSNYTQFSLHTGTAMHETNETHDFKLAANLDLVAISKSGTRSASTELHRVAH